mmetsp:Transcript_19472/g.35028  ORF Transcript_19472/g.35028 Transcript_19472/m.35028 type:complete len:298 (+) Transcript_19472:38-931(+)
MFIPPSFEPNSPREPQWFPRPITDSIESSLDLLERLEEDRKRRLRSIANVAARTPIGLGGIEDHGHAGSTSNLSPKPAAPGNNNYSRYRYYPPPSEASASLHTSYQRSDRFMTTTPASVTTRRDRHYRRGMTPRSAVSSATASAMETTMRDGARTPVDGIGTTTPASNANDRAYVDDSRETPYRNNQSFRSTSSSVPFMSPPLDPRAGGGSSVAAGRRLVRGVRSPYHHQRQFPEDTFNYNISSAATPVAGDDEWATPPAMAPTGQTPGHGQVEDVYTQRRGASHRRRRRGWDELNI